MGPVTCDVTVSSDGFCAGPNQSMQFPLGEGAEKLHRWQFEQIEENAKEIAAITEASAFIMGSHMFGPPPVPIPPTGPAGGEIIRPITHRFSCSVRIRAR